MTKFLYLQMIYSLFFTKNNITSEHLNAASQKFVCGLRSYIKKEFKGIYKKRLNICTCR
jgi:hypothetical protein